MSLFKPYDKEPKDDKTAAAPGGQAAATPPPSGKKNIPTPTRRQAEQARRDRLQPVLTRKQSRAREREARYRARDEAMAKTHARPYNALIRDWVDHRWNLAEFALPVMVLLFMLTIVGSYIDPQLMLYSPYVIWGVFLLLILDTVFMWFGARKHLQIHFPDEPLKGKFSYAFSRSMLMRRSRMPIPRIKRGTKFTWPPSGDLS